MTSPTEPKTRTRSHVLLQFLLLALTWGASFLFVAIALDGLSPAQVVLGRLVTGAVVLAAICLIGRHRLPPFGRVWGHLFVVSLLLCVIPFLLFAWAQQDIASGLASIYNATTPLMTMLISLIALREERPTTARTVGIAVGFLGVMVVLGPWSGVGSGTALAQLVCLGATARYGAAFVYLRRFVSPRGYAAIEVFHVEVLAQAPEPGGRQVPCQQLVLRHPVGFGGQHIGFVDRNSDRHIKTLAFLKRLYRRADE